MDKTTQNDKVPLEVRMRVWLFRHLANPSLALLMLLIASGEAFASIFLGVKWGIASIATASCSIGLFLGFIFDYSLSWLQYIYDALRKESSKQGEV